MAGRARGLAHPQTRKGGTRGPVTAACCARSRGILPLAMKPALWGLRWRRSPRRRGLNRLHEGKQARPGREQPNPRRKRSQVTGGSEGGGDIPRLRARHAAEPPCSRHRFYTSYSQPSVLVIHGTGYYIGKLLEPRGFVWIPL